MSQETCVDINSTNLNLSRLYPTDRSTYCLYIGQLGEDIVSTTIRDILPSFSIPVHDITVNGSDIKIFYDGRLIGKFEVLNFNSSSYIDSKRALSIKENLKGIKYKGLICSFYNATSKARKILKNIPVCSIGFQLLPKEFHQFYTKQNRVHHRRIASIRTLKMLKNTLKSFFHRIGLDLLMYVSTNEISTNRLPSKKMCVSEKNEALEFGTDGNVSKRFKVSMYVSKISRSRIPRTNVSERSEVSVSKEIEGKSIDSKSSTFRDKFKLKLKELVKLVGETFKVGILNLLSWIKALALNLWHDRSGNVALVKTSKTTWKPRYGFYVSDNQVQTRLFRHTYPCKYKIPVICTSRKKVRYICLKEIDNSSLRSLRLYNNNLYCFCPEYGDERCWLNEYICFNVMSRREDCSWSRSTWKEECMYEDNLRRKMKEEKILKKIKNKTIMVKTQ